MTHPDFLGERSYLLTLRLEKSIDELKQIFTKINLSEAINCKSGDKKHRLRKS